MLQRITVEHYRNGAVMAKDRVTSSVLAERSEKTMTVQESG